MTAETDAEYLARRKIEDQRSYYLDPEKSPRAAPALAAVRLLTETWVTYDAIAATALRASDLTVDTVENMVRTLVKCGMLEKRGASTRGYRPRFGNVAGTDNRRYRRADWPES